MSQDNALLLVPVVHKEEGMIAGKCGVGRSRLNPDLLANAILQACSPLPCVHLPLPPLHAPLPLFLVPLPAPTVCVAATVMHAALTMLQVVLPPSCIAYSGCHICL